MYAMERFGSGRATVTSPLATIRLRWRLDRHLVLRHISYTREKRISGGSAAGLFLRVACFVLLLEQLENGGRNDENENCKAQQC